MKKYFYWMLQIFIWGCFSLAPAKDTLSGNHILYTANINAMLQNCGCGTIPLGGLDRIKTFVDSFRTVNPGTIVLDGGDFLNSYPFPELNRATLEAMHLIGYDLIVPGDQEFLAGQEIFHQLGRYFGGKMLLSNVQLPEYPDVRAVFKRNHLRISALVTRDCLGFIPVPDRPRVIRDWQEVKSLPHDPDTFEILVFHGMLSDLRTKMGDASAGYDLILLAHDQMTGTATLSGIPVVGAGKDGEQIVSITFGERPEPEIRYIKISENITPDPDIVRISKQFDQLSGGN